MATRTFLNQSADFADTNNWSGGAVPITDDVIDIVNAGSQALSTNPDFSTVDNATVRIGPNHQGQIGTAAAPWITGDNWTIDIDAPLCPGIYLETGGADTVSHVKVRRAGVNGVTLGGSGTITNLYVTEGLVRVSGTLTVTNVYTLGPNARVIFEGDHTLTTITQQGGTITCSSDVVTLNLSGGTFDLIGDGNTEGDLTTLNQSGGMFYFSAAGRTLGTANLRGGTFDVRRVSTARTVTTANVLAGATAYLDDGTGNVTVTTLNKIGGRVFSGAGQTVTTVVEEGTPSLN